MHILNQTYNLHVARGQRDALVNPDGGREFAQQYRRGKRMQREMWFPPFPERENVHLLVKQTLISPFSFLISPLSEWKGK